MESLNKLVEQCYGPNDTPIAGMRRYLEGNGIRVELELDPGMPNIFEEDPYFECPIRKSIRAALTQLDSALRDARPSRVLYQTQFSGEFQLLMILHNGLPVPKYDLGDLNEQFRQIADGELVWDEWRHDNLVAAQYIKQCRGRIRIENIDENGYTVRTTVEIPIK